MDAAIPIVLWVSLLIAAYFYFLGFRAFDCALRMVYAQNRDAWIKLDCPTGFFWSPGAQPISPSSSGFARRNLVSNFNLLAEALGSCPDRQLGSSALKQSRKSRQRAGWFLSLALFAFLAWILNFH